MTVQNVTKRFLRFSRFHKQALIAVTDTALLVVALWSAFSLRLGVFYFPSSVSIVWLFAAIPLLAIPVFIRFGLYRAIIRYIGFKALWAVAQAVSIYAMLWGLLIVFTRAEGVPRSVILINWVVAILLIGGTRMIARWWLAGVLTETGEKNKSSRTRVVIYGAGSAGVQLATALAYSSEYRPIAFIDDKSEMHNTHVNSLKVYPFKNLQNLIEQYNVEEVLLAIPTASRARRNHIIELLEPFPVHVRTLPGMAEIAGGQVRIDDIKEVEIEDLLGRDPVEPYKNLLDENIHGKVVMVTGAGGSIGSELCRQILLQKPERLILFEQNEFALYAIESELSAICSQCAEHYKSYGVHHIVPILGSVLDQARLEDVCKTFKVKTIYHAAAYKHVPLVEKNPFEAIKNNIHGTYHAAQAANNSDVETFLLISTDKAVRPTNIMGASKRFAELVLQGLAKEKTGTRFSMVRFGNVLGSSGSVVPLFRAQIQKGGPVTVTHPDIIRYFMTIPEAAQLVIQAGAMGTGGDVFVLDMGEPVKIAELARKMVHLSGLTINDDENQDGDISVVYTGLRPGEKLYEELLIGNNATGTKHPRILTAQEESLSWAEIKKYLAQFEIAYTNSDCEMTRNLLLEVISGYKPETNIEDLLWKEKQLQKQLKSVVQLKDFKDKVS